MLNHLVSQLAIYSYLLKANYNNTNQISSIFEMLSVLTLQPSGYVDEQIGQTTQIAFLDIGYTLFCSAINNDVDLYKRTGVVQKLGLVPAFLSPRGAAITFFLHRAPTIVAQFAPRRSSTLPEVVFGLGYYASLRLRQVPVASV